MPEEKEKACPGFCDNGEATIEPHICPFKEDIGNDSKTLCYCCDRCQYECAMDI